MNKKDLYEHLANIYLDASSQKKKKVKKHLKIKGHFLILFGVVGLVIFLFIALNKQKSLNSEFALVLQPDTAKINFNFDPAKKEIYSINLNKLNLSRFKTLGFSAKLANYQDKISLRIEFTNTFKEKSEIYLKNISHKWQDYKISFLDFKNMGDWSEMSNLSFIVEEWNTKEKQGAVYIDNLRFLR